MVDCMLRLGFPDCQFFFCVQQYIMVPRMWCVSQFIRYNSGCSCYGNVRNKRTLFTLILPAWRYIQTRLVSDLSYGRSLELVDSFQGCLSQLIRNIFFYRMHSFLYYLVDSR